MFEFDMNKLKRDIDDQFISVDDRFRRVLLKLLWNIAWRLGAS